MTCGIPVDSPMEVKLALPLDWRGCRSKRRLPMPGPTKYRASYLLGRQRSRKEPENIKWCPVCRRWMREIDPGWLECENCEYREAK